MRAEPKRAGDREAALDEIVQGTCTYCEANALVRDTYKGNAAVVCEDCGTPAAQFW
ncbi:hypothetical protein NP511_00480 [Natrinema thermotolerans]|uniref:Small CPxCG-related zinc finger protein n=1 Tax=Natrinema thermotolerans TaxID=121872 RepID=A0AAF0PAF7_9EURY|nr:HVO_A0556 family zinc finger protein [Natrinema thermotolerans]WMT07495.1 hypothetical protein NP511_19195 [Natrinema thermotolerans]WMT08127.1 hypothetical protein NP511_00480 [Natrinema thermotolerans]